MCLHKEIVRFNYKMADLSFKDVVSEDKDRFHFDQKLRILHKESDWIGEVLVFFSPGIWGIPA